MKGKTYLVVGILIGLILSGCTSSSTEPEASAPTVGPRISPLDVTINMSEYSFSPAEIEAQVGQEVTLTLVNVGTLDHEFMIGNDVEMHDDIPSGYEKDMFRTAGIIPTVHGGGMLMAHDEGGHQDEGSMDMEADNHEDDMDMEADNHEDDMAMEADNHEDDMAMEADNHEEGMAMEADNHEEGMAMEGDNHEEGMTMNLEGEGALMVMMPVSSEPTTITFTATEEMIGEWEMGCFQQNGAHYKLGMVGKFIVKN